MNGGDPGAGSPGSGKACEFQFADLHHSGTLSLVIAYDNGGTAECNDVEIIDKVQLALDIMTSTLNKSFVSIAFRTLTTMAVLN